MCGIAGCTGFSNAGEILIDELQKLEYRGYDSAGMTLNGKTLFTIKTVGKVCRLEEEFNKKGNTGAFSGIAHTRWATHGVPSAANAHPHLTEKEDIAVVHNGILENHQELRHELEEQGHIFRSETDSEVLPHLIECSGSRDPLRRTAEALRKVTGSFAVAVLFREYPDTLICASQRSPLVIGFGNGGNLIASDVLALAPYSSKVIYLRNGEIARITPREVAVYRISDLTDVNPDKVPIPKDIQNAGKNGYAHFMLKEIMEQPETIRNACNGRLSDDGETVSFPEFGLTARETARIPRIVIAGCGSSMHAGLVGQYFFEDIAGIPTSVEQAAEFRYRNPILAPDTLVFAITQSGETADTIAAVREAQCKGAYTVGLCNVADSTIARESDCRICLHAGPEQSVASTKAFTSQVTTLFLLSLFLGRGRRLSRAESRSLVQEVKRLPELVREVLAESACIQKIVKKYSHAQNLFYMGRGCLYPAALEGALKLKEISYAHAEGYHSAELKHGPIALLDEKVPVIALANHIPGQEKMLGNIRECLSRHAPVIAIVSGEADLPELSGLEQIHVPETSRFLAPVTTAVALQLFAYYFALERGCPIDQPRNLAKSVTVE